jgi:large conductance mechanosensitive channel
MKGMLNEFKEFALKGNMMDLAIGIIIGAAFGAIVNSLVNDIIMPPIGLALGKVDFSSLFINLSGQAYPSLAAAKQAGAAVMSYGVFINTLINFLIVALVLFFVVKGMNTMRRAADKKKAAAPPAAPTTKECPRCFSSISLKATRCPNCTSELK